MRAARFQRFGPAVVFVVGTFALFLVEQGLGQQAAKRPLTHDDYDAWRSIQGQQLSRDGKFVAYAAAAQEGDAELVVRNLSSGVERRHNLGSRAAATGAPLMGTGFKGKGTGVKGTGIKGPPAAAAAVFTGSRLAFSPDSRFLLFQLSPTKAQREEAKKAKAETPLRASLGIMDLSNGQVNVVPAVRTFQVAEEGSSWILYRRDSGTDAPKGPAKGGMEQPPKLADTKKRLRTYGSDLVLRNLADGREEVLRDVLDYVLSKDGKLLVYVISSKQETQNGVFAISPGQAGAMPLLTGRGQYVRMTWDENQTQLAFLSDRDDPDAAEARFRLYYWQRQEALAAAARWPRPILVPPVYIGVTPATTLGISAVLLSRRAEARELLSSSAKSIPAGMLISSTAPLTFSDDGSKIFLGVAPPEPEKKADKDAGEDKVVVELWHWKDEYIQPMQKVKGGLDRNRTVRAVFHLADKRFVPLSDKTLDNVTPARAGGWALGSDDRPYRQLVGFDGNYADYYLVNMFDGTRKAIFKKHLGSPMPSPGGKYLLFQESQDWHSYAISDGKLTNLTKGVGVKFTIEDYDSPSPPPGYGLAGWTMDDRFVVLYDKYDLWLVAPDGSGARNLTQGVGRAEHIQFRRINLDPREKAIDLDRPMLLRADNLRTRDTGFYRIASPAGSLSKGEKPLKLVMAARGHGMPVKAKDADVLMLTTSTFYDYPDLHITDMDFRKLEKVSHANPGKERFIWGKSELVRYKNADGLSLSGILIKPENFDPAKKYPMIVYIYEKLSQNLHNFVEPKPGTSINASYYASNGYLVFMPDIVYTVGYPGQSALKCVLPGIQAVVDRGCVDEKAIGIQGHSWGGYQIAYMITQTKRFRAVAAGAPVANMTSAYDGIRWGSGLPRQFQYERTQSRIGGSLWQYPMRFVENSPVFMADRVHTPLMMLHNDQDDAVPWYQGIEYYLALRRLGKEVYLFNYPGELHGLRKRPNQRDYTVRMQQFFDHHLKGAPRPEWMENGIPYRGPGRETPPAVQTGEEQVSPK